MTNQKDKDLNKEQNRYISIFPVPIIHLFANYRGNDFISKNSTNSNINNTNFWYYVEKRFVIEGFLKKEINFH